MDDVRWISVLDTVRLIAAFLVAIGVAGEFLGDWIGKPIQRRIDARQQQEIARLNKEAADARLDLEKERTARLQIERQIGPRYLTADEETQHKFELKTFSGQSIDVFGFPSTNDSEREEFAKTMYTVLKEGGWHANIFWLPNRDAPVSGLHIELSTGDVREKQNAGAATAGLVNALRAAGVKIADPVRVAEFPGMINGSFGTPAPGTRPPAPIRLYVGKK
jgi:hypothetical protein